MSKCRIRVRTGVCALVLAGLAGLAQAAFKEVAYIESTGAQWINTHYVPTCTDTFEMKVRFTGPLNVNQGLWCARGTETAKNTMTCFAWSTDNKLRFDRNTSTGAYSANNSIGTTDVHTVVANYSTQKATIDGGSETTMAIGDFTCGGKLSLLASHQAAKYLNPTSSSMGNYAFAKLYSFKIKDANGTLLHDYVPAVDLAAASDSPRKYGVFDKVAKVFCPNDGKTALLAGEELGEEMEEEHLDKNVITVGEGQSKQLTAAEVAAFGTKPVIKLGKGVLVAGAEWKDFAGDIFIADGFWKYTSKAQSLGTGAGVTFVKGGTLIQTCSSGSEWTATGGNPSLGLEEHIYIEGTGCNNCGAVSNTTECCNFARYVDLTGDTLITCTKDKSFQFRYCAEFIMDGHTLTFTGPGSAYLGFVEIGSNPLRPGPVEVHGGMHFENGGGAGTADVPLHIYKGGYLSFRGSKANVARKIIFEEDTRITAAVGTLTLGNYGVAPNYIAGPVELKGVVTNSLNKGCGFNFGGTVSGDGGFTGGKGGWLQFVSAANSFKGGVSALGAATPDNCCLTGGVSVLANGAVPVNGGALTIGNSQLVLYADIFKSIFNGSKFDFPDIVATGRSEIKSGTAYAKSATAKSLTKTGAGTLDVMIPLTVKGATEVKEGTLRLAPLPATAAGLKYTHKVKGSTTYDMGIDPSGATFAYATWPNGNSLYGNHSMEFSYTGWIKVPGEQDQEVTCNFVSSFVRQMTLKIGGVIVVNANDNKDDLYGNPASYDRFFMGTPVKVKGGWQSFSLWMNNWYSSPGGPAENSKYGWVKNFGVGVDWQGRCETNANNYVKFLDPGDGSFLRADKTTVDPALYRGAFQGAVGFGQGAVLDVNDTAPYTPVTVPELKGMPTIRNGEVKVTGTTWTLRASDFVEGGAGLTVADGAKLTFAPGTTVAFEGDFSVLAHKQANRTRSILSTASGTIVNALRVSGQIPGTAWYLVTDDDGNVMMQYHKGTLILVR